MKGRTLPATGNWRSSSNRFTKSLCVICARQRNDSRRQLLPYDAGEQKRLRLLPELRRSRFISAQLTSEGKSMRAAIPTCKVSRSVSLGPSEMTRGSGKYGLKASSSGWALPRPGKGPAFRRPPCVCCVFGPVSARDLLGRPKRTIRCHIQTCRKTTARGVTFTRSALLCGRFPEPALWKVAVAATHNSSRVQCGPRLTIGTDLGQCRDFEFAIYMRRRLGMEKRTLVPDR